MKKRNESDIGRAARRKRAKHRPLSFSALEVNDLAMLRMLLADKPDLAHDCDLNGMTLLRSAVFQGKTEVVELLRETAGPLDAFEAASLGETARLAEILDAAEAKPDDRGPEGFGLLHLACFFGHDEAAELLLDRGASLEAVATHPMGVRPVHAAVAGRHHALALRLLERGADVCATQAGGITLLHHAAQQGSLELTEELLRRGADPGATSDRGESVTDVARKTGHGDVAERLAGDS